MGINYAILGERLQHLTEKALNDYTKEEITILVQAVIDSIIPPKSGTFVHPYMEGNILIIPHDSDPRFHWWRPCGQSIYETLRELKVSEDIWQNYIET